MGGEPNTVVDDADDDFIAPPRAYAQVEKDELPAICPNCGKPTAKHTPTQAFKCMSAAGAVEDNGNGHDSAYRSGGLRSDGEHPIPTLATPAPRRVPESKDTFETLNVRGTRDRRRELLPPNGNGVVSAPTSIAAIEAAIEDGAPAPPPQSVDEVLDELHEHYPSLDELTSSVVGKSGAEIDYDALARAVNGMMQEQSRNIRRFGTTLEQQLDDMKLRLADMIVEAQKWRARAQANAQRANSLQEQLTEKEKILRRERTLHKEQKHKDHVRKNEIEDILDVVDKTPGWSATMGGQGHWKIYKDGVFISDAASTGGTNQVNRATRGKLRKAGLVV